MAIEYCEVEPNREESETNPWLLQSFAPVPRCAIERDVTEWLLSSTYLVAYEEELSRPSKVEVAVLGTTDKESFRELVEQWKEETWFISSLKKRISNIAYLKIIGLGAVALPWILEELQREPDYWYPALEAIARTDPAPPGDDLKEVREAWLAWGKANGYIA